MCVIDTCKNNKKINPLDKWRECKYNMIPKISVIVPCYNQAQFLPETLDSVLAQTHENWECIIVNDGSTDNTEEVALKYCKQDERFVYLSKKNGGLSSARNAGLNVAQGEYIQLLDSDDILLPRKFEVQLEDLENNSSDFSVCNYLLFSNDLNNTFEQCNKLNGKYELTKVGLLYNWNETFVFPPICYLVRRQFLFQNEIRFDEGLKASEDWAFVVSCKLNHARFSIPQEDMVLALYRRHENNMTTKHDFMSEYLIKANFVVLQQLSNSDREEFMQRKSIAIRDALKHRYIDKSMLCKANSIDYKLGAFLLYPFHKLSSCIKKIIRKFKK